MPSSQRRVLVRPLPNRPGTPRLIVAGNQIVRADTGRTAVLRGADFYITESSGIGALGADRNWIRRMRNDWKGNVAVITFASNGVNLDQDHPFGGNYRSMLDALVEECLWNNCYAMLSYRSEDINGGGDGSQTQGVPPQNAVDAMGFLANRYKNYDHIIYSAQQESNGASEGLPLWTDLQPYFNAVAAAVYNATMTATVPHKPLVLTSGPTFGRELAGALTLPVASGVHTGTRDNIVYKSHPYGKESWFQTWFGQVYDAGLPIWIGGWGYPVDNGSPTKFDMAEADSTALLTYCRNRRIPWTTWVFDDTQLANERLITNASATPSTGWGEHIKAEMVTTPPNIGGA